MTKKKTTTALVMGAALALAGAFGATGVMQATVAAAATSPTYGNYFTSDYETRAEAIKAAEDLNEEIYSEGVVLLKNEDNALPLGDGAKISIFGKSSADILRGGSGSGLGGGGTSISLTDAFREVGFQVNPTLVAFYNDNQKSGSGRGGSGTGGQPTNGNVTPGYNTGETPQSMYTSDIKASYSEYNDAAIVIISRIGGEGFDLPRTMKWNGKSYQAWGDDATQLVPGARSVDDHYLQLDQNEADLIKACGEAFEKVIVLLNTGSQFETGFLDDPGHYAYHENVKAAMWIGYPGGTGLRGLAKVLSGEISPSGHTVDTWARDFKLDPVWLNFANNLMEGSPATKGNQYSNMAESGGNGGGGYYGNYVTYTEDIYVGYRYYETRAHDIGDGAYTSATEVEKDTYSDSQYGGSKGQDKDYVHGTTTTSWNNWYEAHVVYPFGYGLSYTTFTQTLEEHTEAEGTYTVKVKVKNTGSVAGKDVVQLYYTAPYESGGIEKAHVVLCAFEKTGLLQPSAEETVTLTFNVQDMASYDWNDANSNSFKGYELEQGNYEIRLMRDAHTEIAHFTHNVAEDTKYENDAVTGNKVENQFDTVSNYIEGVGSHYLSRENWVSTFPTTNRKLTASENVKKDLKVWSQGRPANDDEGKPYYAEEMPKTSQSGDKKLADLVGKEYDDPDWESYLDQFSVEQLKNLATQGSYKSGINIPELGVTQVSNQDGPAGFWGSYMTWCNETVVASTWNKELSYEKGLAMGNQALWGTGSGATRIGGWYAPAVNIHRSPFSGRNFEYYSEDGYLTGMLAAQQVIGAKEKGLFAYVKHFAVNDQESNRCGLNTWLSEQTMREIYLKPFEICVKVGETLGIMSSLNRIGNVWAGGCYELLTAILRKEWGFHGCVVTDSYMGDSSGLSHADQMIRAGGNLALGNASLQYNYDSASSATATTVAALREAAHGLLYAHANSLAMNTGSTPVTPKALTGFEGSTLKAAVLDSSYKASVATAHVNHELYPEGQDSEITYALDEGSTLPKGLKLATDGTISGTPTEEGNNFGFTVKATYQDCTLKADFTLSVINANGSIVYEADPDLGVRYVGKATSFSVGGARIEKPGAAEGEVFPDITYSLADGSKLPEGLTLAADGTISGTPVKEAKGYKFTVVAGAIGYREQTLEFTLDLFYEVTFEGGALTGGTYGETYLERLPLATFDGTYSYPVSYELKAGSELPSGLTLTEQGYITGTPLEAGYSTFTVIMKSGYAEETEAEFTLEIALAYSHVTAANAKQNEEYTARIDMAQGAGEVTYALKEGSELPEGITLSKDGVLSGTPTTAGTWEITVVASAEGKPSAETKIVLFVEPTASGNPNTAAILMGVLIPLGVIAVAGAVVGTVFFIKRRRKG